MLSDLISYLLLRNCYEYVQEVMGFWFVELLGSPSGYEDKVNLTYPTSSHTDQVTPVKDLAACM